MVSKSFKSRQTPIKDRRTTNLRRRKKTPVNTASAVVASINHSIYTCHRRLIKIFSKLVRITTPKNKSPGYQVLRKISVTADDHIAAVRRSLFQEKPTAVAAALPPLAAPYTRTVFLDLDETLIHSQPASGPSSPPAIYDFVVKPVIDGERVEFYVLKRPFVAEFLEFLTRNGFEIVIFTAGIQEYASLVLEKLDWKGLISHKLYRDSCRNVDGRLVKDLSETGRDLKRAVIVDDNPNSYSLQVENAIPIRPFTDDLGDFELKKLMNGFFENCDEFEDLRDAVKHHLKADKLIEEEISGDFKNSNSGLK